MGGGDYCTQIPPLEVNLTNHLVDVNRTSKGMFPSTCCYSQPVPVSGGDTW